MDLSKIKVVIVDDDVFKGNDIRKTVDEKAGFKLIERKEKIDINSSFKEVLGKLEKDS